MRLSREDVAPVLAILAAGAVGAVATVSLVSRTTEDHLLAGLQPMIFTVEEPRTVAIAGRVTDANSGQPIAAAQVYIEAKGLGVLTRQDGSYVLRNIPAGSHTVTVQRIGYREESSEVNPPGLWDGPSAVLDFRLSEVALELPGLVVNATRRPLKERTSITIRGPSSFDLVNRPLIYIDGVRQDTGSDSSPLDELDPDEIESIEVMRGDEAIARYGGEARRGVILITLKEEAPDR
jgi:hypothetical protein